MRELAKLTAELIMEDGIHDCNVEDIPHKQHCATVFEFLESDFDGMLDIDRVRRARPDLADIDRLSCGRESRHRRGDNEIDLSFGENQFQMMSGFVIPLAAPNVFAAQARKVGLGSWRKASTSLLMRCAREPSAVPPLRSSRTGWSPAQASSYRLSSRGANAQAHQVRMRKPVAPSSKNLQAGRG
jgi:hypothetical protein